MKRDAGPSNAGGILIDHAAERDRAIRVGEHARRPGFARRWVKRLAAGTVRDGLITLEPGPSNARAARRVGGRGPALAARGSLARAGSRPARLARLPDGVPRDAPEAVRALASRMIEVEGRSGGALGSAGDPDRG